jgi:peptide chain release factor 2
MAEGNFWDNPDAAQKTIQKVKVLNVLLKPYEELIKSTDDLTAIIELAAEDPSIAADFESEVLSAAKKYEAFELQAMMSGKQDSCNAIVNIKPGAGGTEACDWAEMLYRMYVRWAQKHGFTVEELDREPNLEAGIQSVQFRVAGEYAYGYLQSEIGVHRLVRISPFGDGGTRHTSFAAVDITPQIDDTIEIEVNEKELEMQTFHSGGPGGQHQNKTQSGVRLIHKSGVRAESRTERSQPKNYANALALLKARLYQIEEQKRLGDIANRYDAKGEIAFGSQIRSYVMQPYTLVRDERDGIELKTPAIQATLDGDVDEFMYAYLRHRTAKAHKIAKAS